MRHGVPSRCIGAPAKTYRRAVSTNPKTNDTDFPTTFLKNTRTHYMLGTGTCNTGLFETYRQFPKGFVSILDDDDEYLVFAKSFN